MDKQSKESIDYIIENTEIIQLPKHLLATFSVTDIDYHFIASIDSAKTRVRQGIIKAEKPAIIHSALNRDILEGFDDEVRELLDFISDKLGTNIRMLGYYFKNNPTSTLIQNQSIENVIEQLKKELKTKPRTALIRGFDHAWQIGLLKLIIEHAGRSFPMNMLELEERGFFPGANGLPEKVQWKIEYLFKKAKAHPAALKELGSFLKEHNLFSDYEDRFFSLVKSAQR